MRIDTTHLSHVGGLMTLHGQTGQGASFDSFVSQQDGDGDTGIKAAPVLSKNVCGFNAFGVLGLGGPAGTGQRQVALPESGGADLALPDSAPVHRLSAASLPPAAVVPIYASAPNIAFFPQLGVKTTFAPQATVASARTMLPHASQTEALPAGSQVALSVPLTTVKAVAGESLPRTGGMVFSAANSTIAGLKQDMPTPRKAAAFRFMTEADPAPGQVSVTATEREDDLHIVAAAPDLTDADRQNLKTLVEEAAAEAGVTLGDLRLNGVVVRQLSKTR